VSTLTFLAIKRIEIKEANTCKIVGQELKFLYEFARLDSTGPLVTPAESDNQEPNLSLLSRQCSGKPSYPSDPIVSDSDESTPQISESPVLSQANSPYIVGFYDAYIDPKYGAVSLVLEYINGGSIQKILDSGNTYDEDCVAVLVCVAGISRVA
jgi:serine/threonine protein kinase